MDRERQIHPLLHPACQAGWPVAFVGVNLLQSGLTGWCLMSNLIAGLVRQRSA